MLQFLKESQDKYIALVIFFVVLTAYLYTDDAFLQRVMDTALGGVFCLLAVARTTKQQPAINAPIENADVTIAPNEPAPDAEIKPQ